MIVLELHFQKPTYLDERRECVRSVDGWTIDLIREGYQLRCVARPGAVYVVPFAACASIVGKEEPVAPAPAPAPAPTPQPQPGRKAR